MVGVHGVGGSFLATASRRGDVTTAVKMSARKVTTDIQSAVAVAAGGRGGI